MTREEAVARAAALNGEAAGGSHWLVREGAEGWSVVRLSGGGIHALKPTGAHTESKPRPEVPPDPRPAAFRNIPPYGAG